MKFLSSKLTKYFETRQDSLDDEFYVVVIIGDLLVLAMILYWLITGLFNGG